MIELKIGVLGVIQALKNLGLWLGTWLYLDVQADPMKFIWALGVYMLVEFASDLYLLNKAHEVAK